MISGGRFMSKTRLPRNMISKTLGADALSRPRLPLIVAIDGIGLARLGRRKRTRYRSK